MLGAVLPGERSLAAATVGLGAPLPFANHPHSNERDGGGDGTEILCAFAGREDAYAIVQAPRLLHKRDAALRLVVQLAMLPRRELLLLGSNAGRCWQHAAPWRFVARKRSE